METWPAPGTSHWLQTTDGCRLHAELHASESEPQRVVVLLHGIGAYAAPYRRLARRLAADGSAVMLVDLRGHGASDGTRGRLPRPRRLLDDIESFVVDARARHPGLELVLAGESMGALISLAYAASSRTRPDRLLLLAPSLRLRWSSLGRSSSRQGSLGVGGGFSVQQPMQGEPVAYGEFRDACLSDPAMIQNVNAQYLFILARLMVLWAVRYPKRVMQPTLILHGDADRLLDMSSSQALADLLPRASVHVVPNAWHNLLWGHSATETMEVIARWVSDPISTANLSVYRWSALHSWLRSRNFGFWRTFGIVFACSAALAVVVAGFAGTLGAPSQAVRAALPFDGERLFALLSGELGSLASTGTMADAYTGSGLQVAIPLLRDGLFWIGLVLLSAYMALQQLHWRAISRAPRAILQGGLIDSDALAEDAAAEIITDCDRLCNSAIPRAAAVLSAGLVTALVLWPVLGTGIYGLLVPPGTAPGEWQRLALAGWWANPAVGNWLTLGVFAGLVGAFVYSMVVGNAIGVSSILMLDRLLGTSGLADRQIPALKLIPEHPDGVGGLGPVRTILRYAMFSTALLFGGFTALLLFMPTQVGVWSVPLLLTAGTVSPLLVSRPIYQLNAVLADKRDALVMEANERIEATDRAKPEAEAEIRYWVWRREVALAMSPDIYSLTRFAVGSALYVVPVIGLLTSML